MWYVRENVCSDDQNVNKNIKNLQLKMGQHPQIPLLDWLEWIMVGSSAVQLIYHNVWGVLELLMLICSPQNVEEVWLSYLKLVRLINKAICANLVIIDINAPYANKSGKLVHGWDSENISLMFIPKNSRVCVRITKGSTKQ